MLAVRLARLCQEEPPARLRPATGCSCSRSARLARSSSAVAASKPAAARHASPSAIARSPIGPLRAAGPQTASTALPRLVTSLRHFHRARPAIGRASKVAVANAAAIPTVASSRPAGNRPTSRIPVTGAEKAWTTPGSRCAVGQASATPYTLAKRRNASASLHTPFCRQTTGQPSGRDASQFGQYLRAVLALHQQPGRPHPLTSQSCPDDPPSGSAASAHPKDPVIASQDTRIA